MNKPEPKRVGNNQPPCVSIFSNGAVVNERNTKQLPFISPNAIFELMETVSKISLSEQNAAVVNEQLASGKFGDPNDMIEAGLNLLQEKQKIAALKEAIQEGIDSGIAEGFTFEKHREKMRRK